MRLYLFILVVLAVFLLFFRLGERPLLSSGEARASEIALEMMQTGNFFVPRLNEEIILTKPPLFHWLIIVCYKIFGVREFSSRIISAVAGILAVLFVYLLGKRFWNEKTGFTAGLLLLTSPLFFWSARCARIDSLLLFFVTISMYCFWRGYEKVPEGKLWFLGWFLFMGLGAMAKGHIAVIVPILTSILFLVIAGKKQYIKRLNWLRGLILLVVIIVPWFLVVYFLVPKNKAELFFLQQNKAWFEGGGEWYKGYVYIPHLFLGFFPWSIALPVFFLKTWKDFRKKKNEKIIFLWLWFFVVFFIFFFFGKKVSRYILPLYPAAALMTAYAIDAKKSFCRFFVYILICLWLFALLGILLFSFYSYRLDPELAGMIMEYAGKILAAGIVILAIGIFGLKRNSFAAAITMISFSFYVFILFFIPIERDYYSPKPFCEMLKKQIPQSAEVRAYKSWDNTIRYYFGRHVDVMHDEAVLKSYLDSPEKVYCFMWQKVYEKLPEDTRRKMYIVKEGYKVLENGVVLVSNKK